MSCKISDFRNLINVPAAEDYAGCYSLLSQDGYSSYGIYSAPEKWWNSNAVPFEPCDVWALGCVVSKVAALIWGGPKSVLQYRSKPTTEVNHIRSDMFRDTKNLKPEVISGLNSLTSDCPFQEAIRRILCMLSPPGTRVNASAALLLEVCMPHGGVHCAYSFICSIFTLPSFVLTSCSEPCVARRSSRTLLREVRTPLAEQRTHFMK